MTSLKRSGVDLSIYWLALGSFAIGTEAFMIAGLLSGMATDLSVSIATAGQLVTVFALAYGLSSPVLTTLTGNIDRRRLLIAAMSAFTVANLLAFCAEGYWSLMVARVLLAFSAGLYMPGANALAGAMAGPEKRGSALAIVTGGTSIAVALGVPMGTLMGHHFGWRMTFAGVAGLSALATAGLVFGLPRQVSSGFPTATLSERLAVAKRPDVLMALLITLLWAMGAYTLYTYLGLFLAAHAGLAEQGVSLVLFLWGVSAAIGVAVGGRLSDRFGTRAVILTCIAWVAVAFFSLSVSAVHLQPTRALLPIVLAISVWGVAHWAFYPAQQARLIGIAGVKVAPIALSLNASFMYLGFSAGAALGSVTLSYASTASLGWVAGLCEAASLGLMVITSRARRAAPATSACPA